MSGGTYTLRYLPHVDLRDRKHAVAAAKFVTWIEAEDHRVAQPEAVAGQLEVVQRFGGGDGR